MNGMKIFKAQMMDYVFKAIILKASFHALTCKKSGKTREFECERFKVFVKASRQPAERRADDDECKHDAVYDMDAKTQIMKVSKESLKAIPFLTATFNAGLKYFEPRARQRRSSCQIQGHQKQIVQRCLWSSENKGRNRNVFFRVHEPNPALKHSLAQNPAKAIHTSVSRSAITRQYKDIFGSREIKDVIESSYS